MPEIFNGLVGIGVLSEIISLPDILMVSAFENEFSTTRLQKSIRTRILLLKFSVDRALVTELCRRIVIITPLGTKY